ncbi:MAG: addiction module antidote protein, HigA family [Legionellaceae bacterium]|nr:addiction module antidote protein, HigA family [Legionellaceae bacterium]|tara:strand:+ start:975 stop:1277 length:303 start_codon:yes stop_codon:yes gene_type:complete
MNMHNPPHPGEFIRETYLLPFEISERFVSQQLGVSPSTFNRLVKEESSISPDMAIRLSAVLGRSPESWLQMQAQYDLWHSNQQIKNKLKKIDFDKLHNAA